MAPVRVSCLQRCSARLWRLNKSICWSPVVCVCVCFCGAPRQERTGGGGLKILTATGSSEARSLSLFLCCWLGSLSLTNCTVNSPSFPLSISTLSSCLLMVLCYAHRANPPAGVQTRAPNVSTAFLSGWVTSGVNSMCQPIFHANRSI